jgi:glycosyltransferase involved in cell wall biosynthesis
MKLSVVIPVYNEERTIADIVNRVRAVPLEKEVIVVDDGSTDGTRTVLAELARLPDVRVIFQPANAGKGAAVAAGFREAAGDVVLIQDADLEYDPNEYPKLLHPIETGQADVVYGSRFLGSGERRVLYFWHTVGNRFLTLVSNMFTNLNLTDMETCYKVFRREVVRSMTIESKRFGIEPEVTAKVARRGYRVFEVPISYYGRTYEEGKKIGWKDAAAALWTIVRYSLGDTEDPHHVGHLTLERMGRLEPYNRWLADLFLPEVGRRILEIGSGFGNMTRFIEDRERVVASDLDDVALERLRTRYRGRANVRIASYAFPLDAKGIGELVSEKLDTVVALNVLEHIEDDRRTLGDIFDILTPGGRLILLVPAVSSIYGTLDEALGHYRRYDRPALEALVREAGFELERIRFVNRLGILGWYVNGRLLRRRVLPRGQLGLFRLMMPLLRAEQDHPPRRGMSLLLIARKPAEEPRA